MSSNITCPICGSTKVETTAEKKEIRAIYGPSVPYDEITDHCSDCGESGDFAKRTDPSIKNAIEKSERESAEIMISKLQDKGISMAYFERALHIPQRTMGRWKAGEVSAPSLSLLRIINTYPWVLNVAESNYDPAVAMQSLLQNALSAFQDVCGAYLGTPTTSEWTLKSTQDAVAISGKFQAILASGISKNQVASSKDVVVVQAGS